MAELEEKLNAILNDPQAMGQILSAARALSGQEDGSGGTEAPEAGRQPEGGKGPAGEAGDIGPGGHAGALPLRRRRDPAHAQALGLMAAAP